MSITLQINSLEVLERLIGGDSQVEVDIRNNIVQNFSKKHLKPLAFAQEATEREIKGIVHNELDRTFFSKNYPYDLKVEQREKIQEIIKVEFKNLATQQIREEVKKFCEDHKESIIKSVLDRDIKNMVRDILRDSLADILKK